MVYRIALSIILLAALGDNLFACNWCSVTTHETSLNLPALMPGVTGDTSANMTRNDIPLLVPVKEQLARHALERSLGHSAFYKTYVEKYYPTARRVLYEYFSQMCPQAIDQHLGQVVELLARHTWFYFKNSPLKFNPGEYWECMLEQCAILDEYLLYARVRLSDKSVTTQYLSYDQLTNRQDPYIRLTDYWRQERCSEFYSFYGFYFDYTNKMFNEGIRFLSLEKAKKYKTKMQRIFRKLKGWRHEKQYEQVVARSDDLINIVRQRLGIKKKRVSNA